MFPEEMSKLSKINHSLKEMLNPLSLMILTEKHLNNMISIGVIWISKDVVLERIFDTLVLTEYLVHLIFCIETMIEC